MSSFLTTPAEICDQILGYLYRDELCNFSLCSKACRNLSLSSSYAGLKLTPESAVAFRDGGKFCSLRADVRKLYLEGKAYSDPDWEAQDGNSSIIARIEELRFCIESIRLFPSVRRVRITYSPHLWEKLRIALWKEVSALPNLKEVGFEAIPVGHFRDQDRNTHDDVYLLLLPATQEFIGSPERSVDEGGVEAFDTPTMRVEILRLYSRSMLLLRNEEQYFSNFPIRSSIDSLRELYITTGTVNLESGPGTLLFPNLVRLEINGHESSFVHSWIFKWISLHCPNIQSLGLMQRADGRASYLSPNDGDSSYPMPKLISLSLQWFSEYPIIGAGPGQPPKRYKRKQLEVLIRKFMDNGMEGLEKVKFLRRPAFGSPHHIIEGGCRITRDEIDGGRRRVRLWWKRPFYVRLGQKSFVEEEEEGQDSEDDLDENFPVGL
ncbi:hypothetical protein TWF506_011289 [Arthrobotrys conoides]|uniref:F-box domain-containing protein n=1 Tax=Arthrobotrys conoides TaxID=74498 RepID=A0AAN8RVG4_9PEZI